MAEDGIQLDAPAGTDYFDKSMSVSISCGNDDCYVLNTIANHFIGNHPEVPYQYKMDFDNGILCDKKGLR